MITVAILTRNRLDRLKECIRSLLSQLHTSDEIFAFDTGSTDGTTEWLASQTLTVRSISDNSGTLGFAEARNRMAQEARGEIVAFIDDDCVASPDWLTVLRESFQDNVAVGGLVLPGMRYNFPKWWSGDIAWTIGMSGPGLIRRFDNCYPSTSNMAVRTEELRRHPFQSVPARFSTKHIYVGGREDAQWWLSARLRGAKVVVELRSIVFHNVPANRINWKYVRGRANADGEATWTRDPNSAMVASAAWDAGQSVVEAILGLLIGPQRLASAARNCIWATRQRAFVSKAQNECDLSHPPIKTDSIVRHARPFPNLVSVAARSGISAIGRKLTKPIIKTIHLITRRAFRIPDNPGRILISAPTYLGDSVLLLPPVELLARNFPSTEIAVWTRYPELFAGMPESVTAATRCPNSQYDVVFVPYFHFGEMQLWRRHLSARAITFDSPDVGFPRGRDYHFARQLLPKNNNNLEVFNLLNLLAQWPLFGELARPSLAVPESLFESIAGKHPSLRQPYVTLQLGSGLTMKEWPPERWQGVAREVHWVEGAFIVFIGGDDWAERAKKISEAMPSGSALNLCGKISVLELAALLSHAQVAIGSCSGPKHLAMAMGAPTFTLYGPSSPVRWGALFDRELHGHICSPIPCLSPREHIGLPENFAMLALETAPVLDALFKHISVLKQLGTLPSR